MDEKVVKIEKHMIGPKHRPFIVAEISGNHQQSLEKALKLVDEAHKAGVHAIKLQTYTAETMTLPIKTPPFLLEDKKSLWCGRTLYELYEEAYTPWEWHKPIFDHARKLGLVAFSSPFDETAVDFLETLNCPCYKIASLELVNHPLIARAAKTKKPLILSTGGATLAEIDEAVQLARNCGCKEIILLKCSSAYPAPVESFNLKTLPHLAKAFQVVVGLSDHSLSIGVAVASISLGASLIEKHITLSRKDEAVDGAFSLEPQEFKLLVEESVNAWKAQGVIQYGANEFEKTEFVNRRSLYIAKDLKAGDVLKKEHIKAVRPGGGLHPKYLETVVGHKVKKDIVTGTPLSWEIFA
jgi:pseudaminic acid synthase